MPTHPILKLGSSGESVKHLQDRLRAHIGDPAKSDGLFGPFTDKLVKMFQSAHGLVVDGIVGEKTWEKLEKPTKGETNKEALEPEVAPSGDRVDDRSEKVIATLHPRLHDKARQLVRLAAEKGITIKLISGTRGEAEQNALYAKGRTTPGPRVTNAKFGFSNHSFGIAADFAQFKGSEYVDDGPGYGVVGEIAESLGFDWGGRWKSFPDRPHVQLRPEWAKGMKESVMLAELRRRKAAGIDAFA